MSAYRCSICAINYPAMARHMVCERCGESTDYFGDLRPHNLEEMVDTSGCADSTAASIYTWRFTELWRAGYDSVTSELLASGDYDLHRMCDAKRDGCSDTHALAIFL